MNIVGRMQLPYTDSKWLFLSMLFLSLLIENSQADEILPMSSRQRRNPSFAIYASIRYNSRGRHHRHRYGQEMAMEKGKRRWYGQDATDVLRHLHREARLSTIEKLSWQPNANMPIPQRVLTYITSENGTPKSLIQRNNCFFTPMNCRVGSLEEGKEKERPVARILLNDQTKQRLMAEYGHRMRLAKRRLMAK